jgi:hypothetical protein
VKAVYMQENLTVAVSRMEYYNKLELEAVGHHKYLVHEEDLVMVLEKPSAGHCVDRYAAAAAAAAGDAGGVDGD